MNRKYVPASKVAPKSFVEIAKDWPINGPSIARLYSTAPAWRRVSLWRLLLAMLAVAAYLAFAYFLVLA